MGATAVMPGPETLFWPETFAAWADVARSVGLGLGGIVAAWIAVKALTLNRRRTDNDTLRLDNEAERLRQQAQALENDRHRLVNDTYVKAIEQLGHEKMEVRLGAIYALERIARDAEDFDLHWSIMETLCAYVRERPASGWGEIATNEGGRAIELLQTTEVITEKGAGRRPPTDVATVFTALKRRSGLRKSQEVKANLCFDFRNCDFTNADLQGIALENADLEEANLRNANLGDINLEGANLWLADLTDTNLFQAVLVAAELGGAELVRANLFDADLRNAKLSAATNLQCAKLESANLQGADVRTQLLAGAILTNANLTGTRFSKHPHELGAIWEKANPPKGLDKIIIDPQ